MMNVVTEPDSLSKSIRDYCMSNDLFEQSFEPLTHPLAGKCQIATYAYYIMKKGENLKICQTAVKLPDLFINHFYLKRNNTIIDLTREQFTKFDPSIDIPYKSGTKSEPDLVNLTKSDELIQLTEYLHKVYNADEL